jgi:hypothetical protein
MPASPQIASIPPYACHFPHACHSERSEESPHLHLFPHKAPSRIAAPCSLFFSVFSVIRFSQVAP